MLEEVSEEEQKYRDFLKLEAKHLVLKDLLTEGLNLLPFVEREKRGNSLFEFTYLKREKKDKIDLIVERSFWTVTIEYDPVLKKIVDTNCDCPDCGIKRSEDIEYECKHIKKSVEIVGLVLK